MASILKRFRPEMSSADESCDELGYRSLNDDPLPNPAEELASQAFRPEQSSPGIQESQRPRVRRKRRGRRVVFPLSAVYNQDFKIQQDSVNTGKTKTFSIWSYWRSFFRGKRLPSNRTITPSAPVATSLQGVANPMFKGSEFELTHLSSSLLDMTRPRDQTESQHHPVSNSSSSSTENISLRPARFQSMPHIRRKSDVGTGLKLHEPCGTNNKVNRSATYGPGNADKSESHTQRHRLPRRRAGGEKHRVGSNSSSEEMIDMVSSTTSFSYMFPKAFLAWEKKRKAFLSNRIKSTKYTLLSFFPKNLFEQFHRIANFYFVLIIILNFLPMINSFDKYVAMIPLLVVLSFQGGKDIAEDFVRYRSDKRVNNLRTLIFDKHKFHEGKHRYVVPRYLFHQEELNETEKKYAEIQRQYRKNNIRTTKYTILSFLPKNLFEQFHRFANCYFVFIILLNFVPQIGAIEPFLSMVPVICILAVQAIKDIVEDYGRYKSDAMVNNSRTEVYARADNKYHAAKWKNVQVGDIVRLFCNKVIPADVLLLHSSDKNGVCYIETSNIDGETNLKQRTICKGLGQDFKVKDFKSIIQCEKPNPQIDKFAGNIISLRNSRETKESVGKENLLLRGCVIRNTDYVEGIVIYAGHETKAMLNNNGPRYKRSKLERRMNLDVIWCVILLIIMCTIGAVGNSLWANYQSNIYQTVLFIPPTAEGDTLSPALSGFYMFWTMVILLQILIPISLYVSIEIVKFGHVYFISRDLDMYHEETDKTLECRALNITEDLGQVQYIFSDKTGTLTENSMVFRRCTVGGCDYPHAANAARIENQTPAPPELNPAVDKQYENIDVKTNKKAMRAQSARSPFTRGEEQRSSYRRPASSTRRAHHRRDLSQLSAQFLQETTSEQPLNPEVMEVDQRQKESTESPVTFRRVQSARTSAHRLAHKHHRRNISSVSAKEIMSNLASNDHSDELERDFIENKENDEDEEFLEADVTPDPVLYKELESICHHPVELKLPTDKHRILDFFINLAICNTVVLSADNPTPSVREEDMEDIVPMEEESKPLLRSLTMPVTSLFRKSTSPSNPEKFRSLTSDSLDGDSNNLYTISNAVGLPDDENNLNNSNSTDPLSTTMSFTPNFLRQLRYEAESPDEAALVYAAHAYGCSLAHRGLNTVTVTLPKSDQTLTFEVLHTLAFDSSRKRMSVVVRDPRTNQVIVYCKGADTTIMHLLRSHKDVPDAEDDDSGMGSEHSSSSSSHQESNDPKVLNHTKNLLDQYARTGLRTLCIAKRVLTEREYKEWSSMHKLAEQSMEDREQNLYNSYVYLEKNLELLGATGVEDRLQEGVPETIEALRKAGMQVWVITGDKQETAVNIGYSCKLIESGDEIIYLNASTKIELEQMLDRHIGEQNETRGYQPEISPDPEESLLSFAVRYRTNSQPSAVPSNRDDHPPLGIVIDGKSLDFALDKELQKKFVNLARRCHSVLVCRATPLQKGQVVKLVKDELHVMTLAIGDGANDVSMIQVADIGVGISGQEGMQAVMSSDFAMARFRFLQKLLLVHGHWNYQRLAMMVLYFFYKNAAFVFLIFWFQFFCGFSGGNPIEQWYLLLYNLIFTSVPPLVNGVLDKDVSARTLLKKPYLYMQGINNEMYTQWSFWINIVDAMYQSLALFFIPYFTYIGSDVGLISWGTPVTTACMFTNLVHLGIETKTWTWIHWVAQILSIVIFFVFSLVYNAACPACAPPSNPYWIMETLIQTSNFWFTILLATVIAILPRYIIRSLQSTLWPTENQRERVREKTGYIYTPSSTTTTSMNNTSAGSSSTYQNEAYDERQNREVAVDAAAYSYDDVPSQDAMYTEANVNENHNNLKRENERGAKLKSSQRSHHSDATSVTNVPGATEETAHGVTNPAYIEEWSRQRGTQDTMNEPETGERMNDIPESEEHIYQSILTDHGAMPHNHPDHVTFAPTPTPTITDNEESQVTDDMEEIGNSTLPIGNFDHGGMTPVDDNLSLVSERSQPAEESCPPLECSSPTTIFVSSSDRSDVRDGVRLSHQLPNMVGRHATPVQDEASLQIEDLYDTIA